MELKKRINDNETKRNSDLLKQKETKNVQRAKKKVLLSRFPIDRTVGSRQNKKKSCSTRRGLRVGTNLVEFRLLQKVGIVSYLC